MLSRWWEGRRAWWQAGDTRLRTRRRLLVYSAPVAALVVVIVLKCVSVLLAGHSAVSSFEERDSEALGSDARIMAVLNVIEPHKAHFAAGLGAALDDRLEEAARSFTAALARTPEGADCPVRVNLVLVQETRGDRAVAAGDGETAAARYGQAREVAEQAPPQCFADNADPDPQRQAVRRDTLPRLEAKLRAPAPPPPPPPAATPPPAGAAVPPGGAGDDETLRRLHPEVGDPLDRLRQILRDGA
ncbi:hypothetical protein [[Mycobacterium] wendilense]|uniref:Tetratricopeptide repeat protein n=1 Tax=[Mycobacterium] wendilense TaxID=3064284 RepID=A0ABN9P4L4_9MYCO|nr:hypothetical protein [Mycolicibacterium sp. MU0050]CAJ1586998.1 hypothetical protein MU0050_004560 [Mycolicibacterium sp. MU0050]